MEKASETRDIYRVQSETSAKIYLVDFGAEIPTCTCTAFAIKRNRVNGTTGRLDGGWCKHLDLVTKEREAEARVGLEKTLLNAEVNLAVKALEDRLKSLTGG